MVKNDKQELNIKRYNYRDREYISIHNAKGHLIKRFEYDARRKHIKNFSTDKTANEESIRNYFQSKSHEIYKPTDKQEFKKEFKIFVDKKKEKKEFMHEFKNENRLLFRKNKKIRNFDYMYMNAEVKVYFDGFFVIARGRSDYIYGRIISDEEESRALSQAVIRAIAPYGSNLHFDFLSWNYVFHQNKYEHFNK